MLLLCHFGLCLLYFYYFVKILLSWWHFVIIFTLWSLYGHYLAVFWLCSLICHQIVIILSPNCHEYFINLSCLIMLMSLSFWLCSLYCHQDGFLVVFIFCSLSCHYMVISLIWHLTAINLALKFEYFVIIVPLFDYVSEIVIIWSLFSIMLNIFWLFCYHDEHVYYFVYSCHYLVIIWLSFDYVH